MDIKQINWAIPSKDNANLLIRHNLTEVIDSLDYMADFCGFNKFPLKTLLRENFDCVTNIKPQIFVTHEVVKQKIEANQLSEARNLLVNVFDEVFRQNIKPGIPLRITRYGKSYSAPIEKIVELVMKNDHAETYGGLYKGRTSSIVTPNLADMIETKNTLEFCISKLKLSDKNHFDEIETVLNDIVVIDSNGVNASSYLNLLGLFFIRIYDNENEHWSRLVEHIVHESAHNLLYHVWYQEAIITDDEGSYYTPFRLDYRPISGVVHAMFVLARTIYAFDALINTDLVEPSLIRSNYNEANNDLPFKDKFFQTVDVARKSGKLTKFGEKLTADCVELVNKCSL